MTAANIAYIAIIDAVAVAAAHVYHVAVGVVIVAVPVGGLMGFLQCKTSGLDGCRMRKEVEARWLVSIQAAFRLRGRGD